MLTCMDGISIESWTGRAMHSSRSAVSPLCAPTPLTLITRPAQQGGAGGHPPALHHLAVDHEGADGAPDTPQEGVHQEYPRPPVVPEQVEAEVVLPVLQEGSSSSETRC